MHLAAGLSSGPLPDAWLAPLFDNRKGVQETLSMLLDELGNGFGFFLKREFAEPNQEHTSVGKLLVIDEFSKVFIVGDEERIP